MPAAAIVVHEPASINDHTSARATGEAVSSQAGCACQSHGAGTACHNWPAAGLGAAMLVRAGPAIIRNDSDGAVMEVMSGFPVIRLNPHLYDGN